MNDVIIATTHAITAEASIRPASVRIGLSIVTIATGRIWAGSARSTTRSCSALPSDESVRADGGETVGDAGGRSAAIQTEDDGEAGDDGNVVAAARGDAGL